MRLPRCGYSVHTACIDSNNVPHSIMSRLLVSKLTNQQFHSTARSTLYKTNIKASVQTLHYIECSMLKVVAMHILLFTIEYTNINTYTVCSAHFHTVFTNVLKV